MGAGANLDGAGGGGGELGYTQGNLMALKSPSTQFKGIRKRNPIPTGGGAFFL